MQNRPVRPNDLKRNYYKIIHKRKESTQIPHHLPPSKGKMANNGETKKCPAGKKCLIDLSIPIFGDEQYWAENGDGIDGFEECEEVHDTMAHLLWGPEWDDPDMQEKGPGAQWNPITGNSNPAGPERNGEATPTSDWGPLMNCSPAKAIEMCKEKADEVR